MNIGDAPTSAKKVNVTPQSTHALSPEATAHAMDRLMEGKVRHPTWQTFLLGMMAGAMIGAGFLFYVTTQMGGGEADWYGLTKLVGGMAFSVGLIMVVLTGADLFTSTTMTVIPLVKKRISIGQWASHWAVVYLANFAGALLLALLVFFSGTHLQHGGEWGQVVIDLASAKTSRTWVQAFFLGVLANFLVCLAVWLANTGRTVTDKVLGIIGPLAMFVAAGFEHSIANMFLIPLGIMIKGEGFTDVGANLTTNGFLVDNLLPVTLGNIVGGSVLVGLFYTIVYLRDPEPGQKDESALNPEK